MICAMAVSTPKPGKREALLAAATEHAAALREQPGCVTTHVLSERGGLDQISISIFRDNESLERALEVTRPVIARHHLEELVTKKPLFRLFDVRGPEGSI